MMKSLLFALNPQKVFYRLQYPNIRENNQRIKLHTGCQQSYITVSLAWRTV